MLAVMRFVFSTASAMASAGLPDSRRAHSGMLRCCMSSTTPLAYVTPYQLTLSLTPASCSPNSSPAQKTEPPREVRDVQRIIDVAREASEKAEHANPFTRGWLRHAAERTAAEQSQLLKQTAPWLENTTIPATYAEANAFRTNASKATLAHMRKPYEDRVRRLNRSRFNERIKQRLAENIEKAKTTHEPIPQPHHRHSR